LVTPGIRKTAGFLIFLSVLALLLGWHSKGPDRFLVFLIPAVYLAASVIILCKTLARKSGSSYSRAGWGSELSALPDSWRRWLLDETRQLRSGSR
jgi:hypothetical protein